MSASWSKPIPRHSQSSLSQLASMRRAWLKAYLLGMPIRLSGSGTCWPGTVCCISRSSLRKPRRRLAPASFVLVPPSSFFPDAIQTILDSLPFSCKLSMLYSKKNLLNKWSYFLPGSVDQLEPEKILLLLDILVVASQAEHYSTSLKGKQSFSSRTRIGFQTLVSYFQSQNCFVTFNSIIFML